MGLFGRKKTEDKKTTASVETRRDTSLPKGSKSAVKTISPVLVQPVITEKSTVNGTYMYRVSPTATKNEISKAFQAKYGKQPRKVNVLNVIGKTKVRGRTVGKRSNWKKAIIYLAKGETVDLYQ